jgi:transcriptional regulator with XRE-family HTH domain
MTMLPELIQLRQLRLELGLTFTALGQAMGLKDPGLIHKLIRGKHQPSELTLYKIRCFLAAHQPHQRQAQAS